MKLQKLLAAITLAAALTGCTKDDSKALQGTWTTDIDVTEYMEEQLGQLEEDLPELSFAVPMEMTFQEDGNYTVQINEEKLKNTIDDYYEVLITAGVSSLEKEVANNTEITMEQFEQFLKDEGYTDTRAYVQELFTQNGLDAEAMQKEFKFDTYTGTFKANEGKMYFDGNTDAYVAYELNDNTLVFTADDQDQMQLNQLAQTLEIDSLFPITFKR